MSEEIKAEYKERLLKALQVSEKRYGFNQCKVKVYDLLDKTKLSKTDFFNELFKINKEVNAEMNVNISLYLAD